MHKYYKIIHDFLRKKWRLFDISARHRATHLLEWETEELENIFALLIFGEFIGIPSAPSYISLNLMPLMENDLQLMLDKVDTASGPVSELFSYLDIG